MTAPDPLNQEVAELMRSHSLNRPTVSRLCQVSIKAVDAWLAPRESSMYRAMQRSSMRLLKLELGLAAPAAPVEIKEVSDVGLSE